MNLKGLYKQLSLPRKLTRDERHRLIIALNSWVLFFLLDKIHREFIVKAIGGTDSLGEKWTPLSESRRIYKPLRGKEVNLFDPSKGTKKDQLANRKALINVDTSRLIKSLKPGKVIGGMYVSENKDQKVFVNSARIAFETKVPYADDVQAVRPFIPDNLQPWMQEAIEKALAKVQSEIRNFIT
jgi:hypothetical protein